MTEPIKYQDRIVEFGRKPASQFTANPGNWRKHPQRQRSAVAGSLASLGWVDVVIENRRTGLLIDGHERIWHALKNDDAEVPFIVVDLSPEEEAQALLSLDAIAAMAETDRDKVDELLRQVNTDNGDVEQFLHNLAIQIGLEEINYDEIWQGMPEFEQKEKAIKTLLVHFETQEDIDKFSEIIGIKIQDKTKYIWFPYKPHDNLKILRYGQES